MNKVLLEIVKYSEAASAVLNRLCDRYIHMMRKESYNYNDCITFTGHIKLHMYRNNTTYVIKP
jgi:hypothetical protein